MKLVYYKTNKKAQPWSTQAMLAKVSTTVFDKLHNILYYKNFFF